MDKLSTMFHVEHSTPVILGRYEVELIKMPALDDIPERILPPMDRIKVVINPKLPEIAAYLLEIGPPMVLHDMELGGG